MAQPQRDNNWRGTSYLDEQTFNALDWLEDQKASHAKEQAKAEKKAKAKRKATGYSDKGVQALRPNAKLIRPKKAKPYQPGPTASQHNFRQSLKPFYEEKKTAKAKTIKPCDHDRQLPNDYDQRSKPTSYQNAIGHVVLNKQSVKALKEQEAKQQAYDAELLDSELRNQASQLAKQNEEVQARRGKLGYQAEKDVDQFGPDGNYQPMTQADIESGLKAVSQLPSWLKKEGK